MGVRADPYQTARSVEFSNKRTTSSRQLHEVDISRWAQVLSTQIRGTRQRLLQPRVQDDLSPFRDNDLEIMFDSCQFQAAISAGGLQVFRWLKFSGQYLKHAQSQAILMPRPFRSVVFQG